MDSPPSQTPSAGKGSSRRKLWIRTIVAAIAGLIIGNELTTWNWKRQHRAAFGTVSTPTYRITSPITRVRALTEIQERYSSHEGTLEKQRAQLAKLDALDKTLLDAIAWVSEALVHIRTSGQEGNPQKPEMLDKLRTAALATRIELDALQPVMPESTSHVFGAIPFKTTGKTGFDPEKQTRAIFKQLTGKDYPPGIELVHDETEGVAGSHSATENRIYSKGLKAIDRLYTLLHESGHAVAQHQEDNHSGFIRSRLASNLNEIVRLEEACSFAFLDAGLHVLHQTNEAEAVAMKTTFEEEVAHLATHYYSGDDAYPHYGGAALFLAARDVTIAPEETFNLLCTVKGSTLSNLSQNIQARLKVNGKRWAQTHTYAGQFDRRQAVVRARYTEFLKLQALVERGITQLPRD